jgi:hypothetical protein
MATEKTHSGARLIAIIVKEVLNRIAVGPLIPSFPPKPNQGDYKIAIPLCYLYTAPLSQYIVTIYCPDLRLGA